MIPLTTSQCEGLAVESVGLPSSQFDVHAPEFQAAIVRAAAVTLTPCTRRELSAYVFRHLSPLAPDHPWREEIRDAVGMLVALGDLVEVPDEDQETGRAALYLAPNSFVELSDGVFIPDCSARSICRQPRFFRSCRIRSPSWTQTSEGIPPAST